MAQTRAKPRKTTNNGTGNGAVNSSAELLNLTEAAAYLRVAETEIVRLVQDQALPGRQLGTEWRFLKSAIQDWLKTPPKQGSREAVLSTFGAWKDDPYVEDELKEIYRRRRRETVGDCE